MSIQSKVDEFKAKNPNVHNKEIDGLVTATAKACMDMIVQNVEFNGRAQNAWWTIQESFNVEVKDESECLPENRTSENKGSLFLACELDSVEEAKAALERGVPIINDGFDAVEYAAFASKFKVLDFLLTDSYIKKRPHLNDQINIHYNQDQLFKNLYKQKQLDTLEYLVLNHNIESSPYVKEFLKADNDKEMKTNIVRFIEKKYLKILLEVSLDTNEENNVKRPKV